MIPAIKNIAKNLLILIVAIQVINLSVDSIEFQPSPIAITIGDFNYFNSAVEYVIESLMSHKDVFPEFQKESGSSKQQLVKHISLKIFSSSQFSIKPPFADNRNTYIVPLYEDYLFLFLKEINPPPPKLA